MAKTYTVRSKGGRISFQFSKRTFLILLLLMAIAFGLFILSLSMGSRFIQPVDVLLHLIGQGEGNSFVLNTLRIPRTLLAVLVGSALAVSGLILQGLIRNPLASPDIIGITSGASFGAIMFIVFWMGTVPIAYQPLWAIAGAFAVSSLIYLLSWKKGVKPITLVLMGIGISAIMKACVTFTLVLSDTMTTTKSYIWLTGSLYGSTMKDVTAMLPWVMIILPIVMVLARTMNVKELGDDLATGLGVKVQAKRLFFLLMSVTLAGVAVAFAGGIEFVGLIAPHVARMIIGRSFIALVPASALVGSILVMLADLVARTAFLPLDVPAGVFTAAIGAPFFIYLLYQQRNR
ncbi:FecCD family ABC transporter permease [Bacillus safensis]|uniref:FecCD family ABC transporter permease n=1 Tax=Bacillus safensis TaxID=561879 RepID=UPI0018E14A48|nr:iron ABC transporter permease [Bacillus safensis]